MRFYGLVLASSALVVGACGGGNKDNAAAGDTGAPVNTAAPTAGDSTQLSTPGAGTVGAAAAAPATGTMHEVKMVGDAQGYRFDPANLTVKQGDGVKFVMVSGGPHNVQFDEATINNAAAKSQLTANMPNAATVLGSPMMMNPNESYIVSFGKVPAGTYNYHCTPHLAMNMKGVITVQ